MADTRGGEHSFDQADTLFHMTNGIRRYADLRLLKRNPILDRAAQWMAEDMYRGDYCEHEDRLGRLPDQRAIFFGYPERGWFKDLSTGENLANGPETAKEVLDGWMNSPDHKRAYFRPEWKSIGIGVYIDCWAQLFSSW